MNLIKKMPILSASIVSTCYLLCLAAVVCLATVSCMKTDLRNNQQALAAPDASRSNANPQLVLKKDYYWVACMDQSDNTIKVWDPTVATWSSSNLEWSWKPTTTLGYTAAQVSAWGGPNDCKLRGITGWGGVVGVCSQNFMGIANYPAGTPRWTLTLPTGSNVHSIEVLPNKNVAVAASDGNWVRVYTSSQGTYTYAQFNINQAHAVLWDSLYNRLWITGEFSGGTHVITALIVGGTAAAPTLTEDLTYRGILPGYWGHDVTASIDDNKLWVSMNEDTLGTGGVYLYDKLARTFTPAPYGANRPNVKSIGEQLDGQLIETVPDELKSPVPTIHTTLNAWSTSTVDSYNPAGGHAVSGSAFYRARIFRSWYSY